MMLRESIAEKDLKRTMIKAMRAIKLCDEIEDDDGVCQCGHVIGVLLIQAWTKGKAAAERKRWTR